MDFVEVSLTEDTVNKFDDLLRNTTYFSTGVLLMSFDIGESMTAKGI